MKYLQLMQVECMFPGVTDCWFGAPPAQVCLCQFADGVQQLLDIFGLCVVMFPREDAGGPRFKERFWIMLACEPASELGEFVQV